MKLSTSQIHHAGTEGARGCYQHNVPELGLFIVCGGYDNHPHQLYAAQKAAHDIADFLIKEKVTIDSYRDSKDPVLKELVKKLVNNSFQHASHKIWEEGQMDPDKRGMGCTIGLALICGSSAFVAHVGDCRGHLMRRNKVHQLTNDHILANELAEEGVMTVEEAFQHPKAYKCMRAVGLQEIVALDLIHLELAARDIVLLSTSGINQSLNLELLATLKDSKSFKELPAAVIASAGSVEETFISAVGFNLEAAEVSQQDCMVESKVKALGEIPLFNELDYQQLAKVMEVVDVKSGPAGVNVVKEGATGEKMFVILRGKADVYISGQRICGLGPGQYFGEMALIDKCKRSATVRTTTNIKLIVLERAKFFSLLKKDTRMASKIYWAFAQTLNQRLRDKDEEVILLKKQMAA